MRQTLHKSLELHTPPSSDNRLPPQPAAKPIQSCADPGCTSERLAWARDARMAPATTSVVQPGEAARDEVVGTLTMAYAPAETTDARRATPWTTPGLAPRVSRVLAAGAWVAATRCARRAGG